MSTPINNPVRSPERLPKRERIYAAVIIGVMIAAAVFGIWLFGLRPDSSPATPPQPTGEWASSSNGKDFRCAADLASITLYGNTNIFFKNATYIDAVFDEKTHTYSLYYRDRTWKFKGFILSFLGPSPTDIKLDVSGYAGRKEVELSYSSKQIPEPAKRAPHTLTICYWDPTP